LGEIANCQNNSYTNVDTNYLRPTWMAKNLKVKTFKNGELIYEAKSIEEFNEINKKQNTSAFIIEKGEYFYNWHAVNDPNKLAPEGFLIPSPMDFKRNVRLSDSSLILYDGIKFHSLGYVDNYEGFLDNSGNSLYYWTNKSANSSVEAMAFFLDESINKVWSLSLPMYKNFGLSVRCIEDIEKTIKTKDYSYELLMPKEYEKLLINLVSITKEQHTFSNGDSVSINGKIGFSRNGSSLSKLNNIEFGFNFRNQKIAESMIQKQLLSFTSKPYYKGYLLQSETDFNLSIKHQEMPYNRKQELYPLRIKNPSAYNSADIERAYWCDFKCNIIEKKFTVTDNGNIITSEITKGIESFKSKGPIYALGSVVPGLGLSSIRSFYFISTSITALWISSLSLGAVSIASKLYSNHYYKQYRNDIYNSNADENYKKANVAQKIFLSSAIGYGVLGILDFSFTFTIGCKNKSAQRQLNKSIKTKGVILLK